MPAIAAWLGALAWPLVSRVIVAMGLGTVTYIGLNAAITAALTAGKAAMSGLGADVASLIALSGFFEAIAITAGGIVASLAFSVVKRFSLQVK